MLNWRGSYIRRASAAGILPKSWKCRSAQLTSMSISSGGYPVDGKQVKPGMTIDQTTADRLLKTGLVSYENDVLKLVRVKLTQGQFDALVSFAYNVGSRALSTSTLLKKLNAGDIKDAADEFLRWNKAGGKVMPGLTNRRTAERDVFLS
ncbi:lysozyme [Citrobacter amalonaticus]|nr:lysozyme [Citrobacter amalonaticus]MBJ9276498.1 lysozyme [Citrobacter amalonaticus]